MFLLTISMATVSSWKRKGLYLLVQGEDGGLDFTYNFLSIVLDEDKDMDKHSLFWVLCLDQKGQGRVLGKMLLSFMATLSCFHWPDRGDFSFCLCICIQWCFLVAGLSDIQTGYIEGNKTKPVRELSDKSFLTFQDPH